MLEISGMQAAKWLKHHNKSANRKVTAHGTLRMAVAHESKCYCDGSKEMKLSSFFSTSLATSFRVMCGSLNFLSVHSCSQNFPLISCMSALQWGVKVLGLISITGVKHLPALLAKKISVTTPNFLARVSVEPLMIYNCALYNWKLTLSARYSTCKYTVTLKPRSKVTQGYQKWYVYPAPTTSY